MSPTSLHPKRSGSTLEHGERSSDPAPQGAGRVVLCLGPTNTGKTHRAIERMLEHRSGMLGLPLRLLAREIYDRICARIGQAQVALVTGEEKRVPSRARYFVCTVEAMPIDRRVDFLCVDEIQLAAHPERGHVFTDRLLFRRGEQETWFLGSESMRSLCRKMIPTAEVHHSPRLSVLRSEGGVRMGTLKPRAAVVAFSMHRVYELAERIKARRGGVAVVLGALSPRARNAQVAMYESKEVDYLVATDAIGMGLNLDLDRVAFAETRKFDGNRVRDLSVGELGQIAGRAGRHQRDGYFSTFAPERELPREVVHALETHRVPPVGSIYYRNPHLDFSSLEALGHSLSRAPRGLHLENVPFATDFAVFLALRHRPEIATRTLSEDSLRLFWDVCQVPDYRKLLGTDHAQLLCDLFIRLHDQGLLAEEYFEPRLRRLREHHGDLDSLLPRLAACRTLSYIAGRSEWVTDSPELKKATERLEDELSDSLHKALTDRFVVRKRQAVFFAGGTSSNKKKRESHKQVLSTLYAELVGEREPPHVAEQAIEAPHDAFELDARGRIVFLGVTLATLCRGKTPFRPDVRITLTLPAGTELQVLRRLRAYVKDLLGELFEPIDRGVTEGLSPAANGIAYQLRQGLGTVRRSECREQVRALTDVDRKQLSAVGVKFGKKHVYLPALLEKRAIVQRTGLTSAHLGLPLPEISGEEAAIPAPPGLSASIATCLGYCPVRDHWIRVDIVEEILSASQKPAEVGRLAHLLRCSGKEIGQLRSSMGPRRQRSKRPGSKRRRRPRTGAKSPPPRPPS